MASEQMISYKLKNETEEKGSETPAGVYNKKEAHDKTYKSSIKMMADNSKSSFNKKNDYPQYPITGNGTELLIIILLYNYSETRTGS